MMASALAAPPPLWWSQGNPPVIDPAASTSNRGPANIGQAKYMAKSALNALSLLQPTTAAAIEFELVGPGNPIPSWAAPANQAERDQQHAPLLIGQLKAISDPFYTRLHAVAPEWLAIERYTNGTSHLRSIFPWSSVTTDDKNKAVANIGQLKAVFSLRFDTIQGSSYYPDSDADGTRDALEQHYYGTDPNNSDGNGDGVGDSVAIQTGISATSLDTDGDGISNAQELLNRTSPILADTDGDGVNDVLDPFPLDVSRWATPASTSGDTSPPQITLITPENALPQ